MRFVTYRPADQAAPRGTAVGVVIGDRVAPLTDIDDFYADIEGWTDKAGKIGEGTIPVADLQLAAPVPRDAKVVCTAINYVKHGAESKLPTPSFPNMFARWSSELVPSGTPVPVPVAETEGLDWEVELVAIVGKVSTDVDAATGAANIFGYTVANDISARLSQMQAMTLSTGQWALGKNPDKSGAIGSFIQTADSVDVNNLKLEAIVDGEVMQSGTTADFIFSVGELVSWISRHVTLRPGDVIFTGTPDGVGFGRNPRVYMKPGASVTVTAEGICSVTNPIVGPDQRF